MPTDSEYRDMTTTDFLHYAINAMLESTEAWETTLAAFIEYHGWVLLPADLL